MRGVCREAKLSPRYFYESFADREDLLLAVYNRVEERLLRHIFSEVSVEQGGAAPARELLRSCADFFAADPRRARILLREPLADDTLRNHSAHRASTFLKSLVPLVGARMGRLLSPDENEVALISTAMAGALIALYLDWSDGRLNVSRDELVDTAARIVIELVGPPSSIKSGR